MVQLLSNIPLEMKNKQLSLAILVQVRIAVRPSLYR